MLKYFNRLILTYGTHMFNDNSEKILDGGMFYILGQNA